jgi:putative endonuclease
MDQVDYIVCYVISTHYGTYYTGITNNLIRRWSEHKAGKSSYLRKFKPKEVIHIELFGTRKEAAKKEKYIKRVGAKKYLLNLQHKEQTIG